MRGPSWHRSPSQPSGQVHSKAFTLSSQLPPFAHGYESHSLISTKVMRLSQLFGFIFDPICGNGFSKARFKLETALFKHTKCTKKHKRFSKSNILLKQFLLVT